MLQTATTAITNALGSVNIAATIDARALCTPGAFVTVTKISRCTLTGEWLACGEITLVVPDHGGRHDLAALDAILEAAWTALSASQVEITEITTNEQVTPPTGGKLPAATIKYTIYV